MPSGGGGREGFDLDPNSLNIRRKITRPAEMLTIWFGGGACLNRYECPPQQQRKKDHDQK